VSPPGIWGAEARRLWGLEPGLRFLNHGGFGATPLEILAEQAAWRARMERNPPRFLSRDLPGLLRQAAGDLAGFVGTAPERLAFVTNATAGANAVLRSLSFAPGDEILHTDHIYNAVRQTLRHVAARSGACCVEVALGMPVPGGAEILAAIAAAFTGRTRLLVIDHVASASAVEFPVAALAALCRARGIALLVDGAHAPGLLDLDVDAIGADWYVGNCHKWLCAPKGAGFIAVADRPTPPVHPPVISHFHGQGFTAEFDWTGTQDPTAMLCVPSALRFHARLGGAALRARNRAMAAEAASRLALALGGVPGGALQQFHAMATIVLPQAAATPETVRSLQAQLLAQHNTEAVFTLVAGRLSLRVSVQAYTEAWEFDGLDSAILKALEAQEAVPS
jgi:isopenicillin-N epimerase